MPTKTIPVEDHSYSGEPTRDVVITAPNLKTAIFTITGIAPLMIHRFSKKAEMMATMAEAKPAGSRRRTKSARDYEKEASDACYKDGADGWHGLNAAAFRNAMISACRLVGFKMTLAKLSIFIEPEGFDAVDFIPLVRIDAPKYRVSTLHARNATGVIDIRSRPLWDKWKATLKVTWDADQFTITDVTNLLARAGLQVGVGEGRPDSKQSAGMGFGLFTLKLEGGDNAR